MQRIINRKGFTLIELLIVIAIIGILAVAFLPSILGAPASGRDTARVADLQRVQKVLVESNLSGTAYPANSTCIDQTFGDAALRAALGGIVPTDPIEANVENPRNYPVAGGPPADCDGEYTYVEDPDTNGTYAFGLYAKVESAESANASCTSLLADAVDIPSTPADDDDACYAILTQ